MRVLTLHELLRCYARGEFPMANDRHDPTIYLINPERRGIIPLDRFAVARSLRKTVRRGPFEIRVDTAFPAVIRACAEPTAERPRTWLNDGLIELYTALFEHGHAHSVECWQAGELVGGLYGVSLGAAFFGESMFSRARDASKVALVELVGRLRAGGFELLDTQFVTDHLRQFGAIEIPRAVYHGRLRQALARAARFPRDDQPFGLWVVDGLKGSGACSTGSSQRSTQTS
jgi:leucyl/phenylalanyl-tRNA---protein transferase